MFASRDKDFRARDFITAVCIGDGFGTDKPQICPAMGFGQAHCPRPFARDHFGQISLFKLISSMMEQSPVRPFG